MNLCITAISKLPMVNPGDDLAALIFQALLDEDLNLKPNDILVITQKIVSKSENRLVNLSEIVPGEQAIDLANRVRKDPRLVEVVLRESKSVVRSAPGVLIVENRLGFISANAGVDHSNVRGSWGEHADWVLLLPENPDRSAQQIREKIQQMSGVEPIGVLIVDSHGRAWRVGTVGMTIGLAGIPGVVDLRGREDVYGYKLQYTIIAAADELAAAASLVMGQVDERTPVVHVRGFPYPLRESHLGELLRPEEQDLFR